MVIGVSMYALEFIRVSKAYDGKIAVKDFSMGIKSGETVALLGPNGSGKTTLIRIAVGILRPTLGDVLVKGKSITMNPIDAKKVIGFVPDEPYVYDVLSGYENLQFVADLWGIDIREKNEEILRLAQAFEMISVLDDAVSTYSAGMRRKLSFMMALIHDPEILIIDEITAGLDPKSLATVELIIAGLKKRGVGILFSTHILEVAEALADRIVIIHRGEKIWEGASKDIRAHGEANRRLKDIFFELTGGPDYDVVMKYLAMRGKK